MDKHFSDIKIHSYDPSPPKLVSTLAPPQQPSFVRQNRKRSRRNTPSAGLIILQQTHTEQLKFPQLVSRIDLNKDNLDNNNNGGSSPLKNPSDFNTLRNKILGIPSDDKIISEEQVYVHVRRRNSSNNQATLFSDLGQAITSRLQNKHKQMIEQKSAQMILKKHEAQNSGSTHSQAVPIHQHQTITTTITTTSTSRPLFRHRNLAVLASEGRRLYQQQQFNYAHSPRIVNSHHQRNHSDNTKSGVIIDVYPSKTLKVKWNSHHNVQLAMQKEFHTPSQIVARNFAEILSVPSLNSSSPSNQRLSKQLKLINTSRKLLKWQQFSNPNKITPSISQELLQSESVINRQMQSLHQQQVKNHNTTIESDRPAKRQFLKRRPTNLMSLASRTLEPPQKTQSPKKHLLIRDLKLELLLMPDACEFHNIVRQLFSKIDISSQFLQPSGSSPIHYRAFIGKGNNSALVRKCLKNRGCWIFVDNIDEGVNFVWTQTKLAKFLDKLPSRLNCNGSTTNSSNNETAKPSKKQVSVPRLQHPVVALGNNALLKQISTRSLTQYPLLQQLKCMLGPEHFMHYLKNMIQIFTKTPKKLISMTVSQIIAYKNLQQNQNTPKTFIQNPRHVKMHNHVGQASAIGNKKGLFFHISKFYTLQDRNPFEVIPETLHLQTSDLSSNPEDLRTLVTFGLPCILKPGECTNRGKGITVHTTWESLHSQISKNGRHQNGEPRTHIIQKYIMPLLYNRRKFDIRVWVLWNARQAWWYHQGYVRTSCKEFSLKSNSKFVHLTNDAVQKYSDDYGKYQSGNKLSFNQFQKYLAHTSPGIDFENGLVKQMRDIAKDVFTVAAWTMDKKKVAFGYQLFGLDFMIDEKFKVWLIEANTNPCLETSCSLLSRLVTNMIDGVVSIAVDSVFQPPKKRNATWNIENFRFQLLYDANLQKREFLLDGKLSESETTFVTEEDQFQENGAEEGNQYKGQD